MGEKGGEGGWRGRSKKAEEGTSLSSQPQDRSHWCVWIIVQFSRDGHICKDNYYYKELAHMITELKNPRVCRPRRANSVVQSECEGWQEKNSVPARR